jgi:predicted RNA-binding Zn-ribbon protein involved in translation (DUF1610 family)
MKVLGCKVTDEIYQQFKDLGRPISDSLRDAIDFYLKNQNTKINSSVNQSETKVNPPQFSSTNKPSDESNRRLTTNIKPPMTNKVSSPLFSQNHSIIPIRQPHPTPQKKGFPFDRNHNNQKQRIFESPRPTVSSSKNIVSFACPICHHIIHLKEKPQQPTIITCPSCHNNLRL